MRLARALAVTALSAGPLAGGASAAAAVSAQTPPPTSKAPGGREGAGPQDTSQLSQDKIDNARTIIAVGKASDLSTRAQKIAVMTALQESSLRNLDSGDKDSAGLFQQRPSYGWGTHGQITDSVYASKSFYGVNPECPNPGLLQITGWETMDPGAAAQAVQGSGHPDAYDKWETLAEELVDENQDVSSIA